MVGEAQLAFMLHNIAPWGLSLLTGAVLAVQDIPGADIADRVGIGAIAVMVIGWMLTSFSKRLDKLTDSIDRLSGHAQEKK